MNFSLRYIERVHPPYTLPWLWPLLTPEERTQDIIDLLGYAVAYQQGHTQPQYEALLQEAGPAVLRLAPAQHVELFPGIQPAPQQPAEALTQTVREAFGRFVEALRAHRQPPPGTAMRNDTLQNLFDRAMVGGVGTPFQQCTMFSSLSMNIAFVPVFFSATEEERVAFFTRLYADPLTPDNSSAWRQDASELFARLHEIYTQPNDVDPEATLDEPIRVQENTVYAKRFCLFARITAVYGNRRREALLQQQALAFAMAAHRRLGARATVLPLGSDIIGHIARLVLQ